MTIEDVLILLSENFTGNSLTYTAADRYIIDNATSPALPKPHPKPPPHAGSDSNGSAIMPNIVTSCVIITALVVATVALSYYIYRVKAMMGISSRYKTYTVMAEAIGGEKELAVPIKAESLDAFESNTTAYAEPIDENI